MNVPYLYVYIQNIVNKTHFVTICIMKDAKSGWGKIEAEIKTIT